MKPLCQEINCKFLSMSKYNNYDFICSAGSSGTVIANKSQDCIPSCIKPNLFKDSFWANCPNKEKLKVVQELREL